MIGSCWLFRAFIEDITSVLHVFDAEKIQNGNHTKNKERFCKIIQLYSDVKELSDEYYIQLEFRSTHNFTLHFNLIIVRFVIYFNQIYEFLVFIFIGWSLLAICSILIVLNAELVKCLTIKYPIFMISFCSNLYNF